MLRNSSTHYGLIARLLHWVMAIGILGMIAVGLWMTDLPDGPQKGFVYMLHKSTGFTLLLLLIFRLYWRLTNSVPPLPNTLALWQKFGAHATHVVLYLYMFGMTVTGTLMSALGQHGINWFGLVQVRSPWLYPDLAKQLHGVHVQLTNFVWIFLVAHMGMAFYHHWVLKDKVLLRMLKE